MTMTVSRYVKKVRTIIFGVDKGWHPDSDV
jgi:hypothetical protein